MNTAANEVKQEMELGSMRFANAFSGRWASMLSSLALAAVFLLAGWTAMPLYGRPVTWSYRTADGKPVTPADPVPVFVMRPDRSTLRVGNARIGTDGRIDTVLFNPADPLLIDGSQAVLFAADLRLLWVLASAEERGRLRVSLDELGQGAYQAVGSVLNAPEFIDDYRDAMKDIVGAAIETAWNAPSTRDAYEEFLRGVEPAVRDAAAREIKPIIAKRAEPLIWKMIDANLTSALDLFHAQSWDFTPVEQALDAVVREVIERGIAERTARRLIDGWAARALAQTFTRNAVDALAHDPASKELLIRLFTDQRLVPYLAPLAEPANTFGRTAPAVLFGVHPHADLNAVAAYTFRGFVTGRPGQVIILMNPHTRDEMRALDPYVARILISSATP